jgi:hypothetical protein
MSLATQRALVSGAAIHFQSFSLNQTRPFRWDFHHVVASPNPENSAKPDLA